MIIAVDGYSSTGNSTVAKLLAARLGLTYIDTGAMYRAVTYFALRMGYIVQGEVMQEKLRTSLQGITITLRYNSERNRYETYLNQECIETAIRGMEVSENVSMIAALDFVRDFLVHQQREMGKRGDVIMDGRDIGSVVFPDADVKFFMTASLEVRAMRRYKELQQKGDDVSYQEVKANVEKRDYIDSHRTVSPLKQMPDAVVVDNSEMTLDEELEFMVKTIEHKTCKN